MSAVMEPFNAVFNTLIVVIVITLLSRRLNFPQTLGLIIAGIYSGAITSLQLPQFEAEIFMTLLLPPILFQETLHLNVFNLIDETDVILSYAVAGTLAMVASISLFSWFALGFGLVESLILGIVVAPTDPVAVISTFQNMGVVKRFQLLVAGESLFNDGVAIVIYSLILTSLTVGALSALDVVRLSLVLVFGGIVIGVLGGYVAHSVFCFTDDKFVEVLVSFMVVFGGFRLAEGLGSSGVLATVFAGLILNYRCKRYGGLWDSSIEMLDTLWEFVAFIAQSFAFIFIGINIETEILFSYAGLVVALFCFTVLARYVMVKVVAWLIRVTRGKVIPDNWTWGMAWSGLRGGVSVVLALGAEGVGLPHGEEILALTFGVVLVSNIVQGISMSRVVKLLKLEEGSGVREE